MGITDEDVVKGLIRSVTEPVLIIIPNVEMSEDDYVKLFNTLEEVLLKIEKKVGAEFDILIDSASAFGGYKVLADEADEQKLEAENPFDADVPI